MKALALYSGGLDSILAIKIVEEQNVEVIPVHFYTGFAGKIEERFIEEAEREYGIKGVKIVDIREDFLKILKEPKFGYGKNLNPCIDCKILFFRKTKQLMEKYGASFVITGEVLGQRPMTQNKNTLFLIEKESSLKGLILRPLSAKLLPPTIPEEKGWVERNKLYSISGRGRKEQMKLAKKFVLKSIPTPAGGCLLTDPNFSKRLKILMEKLKEYSWEEIELVKLGRMFEINNCILLIARDEKEKKVFINSSSPVFDEKNVTVGCIIGNPEGKEKEIAGIILRYSKIKGKVFIKNKWINADPLPPEIVHSKLVGAKL